MLLASAKSFSRALILSVSRFCWVIALSNDVSTWEIERGGWSVGKCVCERGIGGVRRCMREDEQHHAFVLYRNDSNVQTRALHTTLVFSLVKSASFCFNATISSLSFFACRDKVSLAFVSCAFDSMSFLFCEQSRGE